MAGEQETVKMSACGFAPSLIILSEKTTRIWLVVSLRFCGVKVVIEAGLAHACADSARAKERTSVFVMTEYPFVFDGRGICPGILPSKISLNIGVIYKLDGCFFGRGNSPEKKTIRVLESHPNASHQLLVLPHDLLFLAAAAGMMLVLRAF